MKDEEMTAHARKLEDLREYGWAFFGWREMFSGYVEGVLVLWFFFFFLATVALDPRHPHASLQACKPCSTACSLLSFQDYSSLVTPKYHICYV